MPKVNKYAYILMYNIYRYMWNKCLYKTAYKVMKEISFSSETICSSENGHEGPRQGL